MKKQQHHVESSTQTAESNVVHVARPEASPYISKPTQHGDLGYIGERSFELIFSKYMSQIIRTFEKKWNAAADLGERSKNCIPSHLLFQFSFLPLFVLWFVFAS